jgi:hypothetical protein
VRPEDLIFFEVLSVTYHSPITIESITYRVLLNITSILVQTSASASQLAGDMAAAGRTGNAPVPSICVCSYRKDIIH